MDYETELFVPEVCPICEQGVPTTFRNNAWSCKSCALELAKTHINDSDFMEVGGGRNLLPFMLLVLFIIGVLVVGGLAVLAQLPVQ